MRTVAGTVLAEPIAMKRNMALVPAGAGAFSDEEEEFFRAGAALDDASVLVETFADLDDGYSPASFWSRVIGNQPVRAATEPPIEVAIAPPRSTRVPTAPIAVEDDDDDDEWEWQIAIARARVDPETGSTT